MVHWTYQRVWFAISSSFSNNKQIWGRSILYDGGVTLLSFCLFVLQTPLLFTVFLPLSCFSVFTGTAPINMQNTCSKARLLCYTVPDGILIQQLMNSVKPWFLPDVVLPCLLLFVIQTSLMWLVSQILLYKWWHAPVHSLVFNTMGSRTES